MFTYAPGIYMRGESCRDIFFLSGSSQTYLRPKKLTGVPFNYCQADFFPLVKKNLKESAYYSST